MEALDRSRGGKLLPLTRVPLQVLVLSTVLVYVLQMALVVMLALVTQVSAGW